MAPPRILTPRAAAARHCARFVQRAQDLLDLGVAFGDLGLVKIVELESVAESKDVLCAVVPGEGRADGRLRSSTSDIPELREPFRGMVALHDGADDPYPGGAMMSETTW